MAIVVLIGCMPGPDLPPRSLHGAGATPELVPISQIVARYNQPSRSDQGLGNIEGRVASLRARAQALRGPVIPAQQRARLLGADARLR